MASMAATFEPTLSCVSITPLGRPVEPEVKITVSKSSGLTRFSPSRRSKSEIGISQASAAETILSQSRDLSREIFEQHDLGVDFEIEPIQNPPAGKHVPDAALLDAGIHHLGSDGVIQVHGHAAVDGQRGVGDHSGDRGRQQYAHELLVLRKHVPRSSRRKRQRAREQSRRR